MANRHFLRIREFFPSNRYWRRFRNYFRGRRLRVLLLLALLFISFYLLYLDITIRDAFEGKKFALPARVFARPLELYPGAKIDRSDFAKELKLLGYRESANPIEPGSYKQTLEGYIVNTREFTFWDQAQSGGRLNIEFNDETVKRLSHVASEQEITLTRLDPPLIGGIYPGHNEDRALVKLNQVPNDLVHALFAIEDRKFHSHWGIDPRGIARAIVATLSGKGLQGGSTITQQLVKNFFLTSERTLRRKFTEMLMALLLELHYEKDEILETYINEVYLGQDANRAIHGFGLASHFYFDLPLERLQLHQQAMLVGMVKGPGHYDPRQHPQRTRERRDLVLQEMARLEYITQEQYVAAKQLSLGIVTKPPTGTSPYPAFIELVHRQLRSDYNEEDLRSEGLRIFTTLDPRVQAIADDVLAKRLAQLERARRLPADSLEGAVVITRSQNGEVLAVVGGRKTRYAGFNRALDAKRPVGSLIKPVVYLTALERPDEYTLITPLDDQKLVWKEPGIEDWIPQNYDKEYHGMVPLKSALVNSYNIATARLGLAIGPDKVINKLQRLGVDHVPRTYAASLLGANELSVIEIAQVYQSLASGGFRTPLRAIREIVTADGKPLQRYSLKIEAAANPATVYLLTHAMQDVVRNGTAKGLRYYVPEELAIAGKTGTTDELRDSWFAGFSGDKVAVVWVGRDDNQSTGLTGAGGAMTLWGGIMKQLEPQALQPLQPDKVEMVWIDPANYLRADSGCYGAVEIPFIANSAPTEYSSCVDERTIKRERKRRKNKEQEAGE